MPIYLEFHRIEFTWFHYSRTVLAFCCTGPSRPERRETGVTRYATLWCPDFPLYSELDSESYEIKLKTQDAEMSSA
jgi:hypothetical protein